MLNIREKAALRIALVQSAGPGEDLIQAFVGGRFTLCWSEKGSGSRFRNIRRQIEEIVKLSPPPDLILLPEYAAPIIAFQAELQSLCDKHSIAILAGADIYEFQSKRAAAAMLLSPSIPARMIPKRHLSDWEIGLLDESPEAGSIDSTDITLSTGSGIFKIRVHSCIDFLYAKEDGTDQSDYPTVHIVLMCSPQLADFEVVAESILSTPAGAAVILANCVGGGGSGGSALYAVSTLSQRRFKPIFRAAPNTEQVYAFDLHLDRLKPPVRRTKLQSECVQQLFGYNAKSTLQGAQLVPIRVDSAERDNLPLGVLNPYLYRHSGVAMRIAFLNSQAYSQMEDHPFISHFECLSVLGHHDLLVTHLCAQFDELQFDLDSIPHVQQISTAGDEKRIPYFEVTDYFKVLGHKVPLNASKSFQTNPPTEQDLAKLLRLARNFSDAEVSEKERALFSNRGWLIGTSVNVPGQIRAILTINLLDTESNSGDSPTHVIAQLADMTELTSIYGGTSVGCHLNFVCRSSCDITILFEIINKIHNLFASEKIRVRTNTYIVAKSWQALDISRGFPKERLPEREEREILNIRRLAKFDHSKDPLEGLGPSERLQTVRLWTHLRECLSDITRIEGLTNGRRNELLSDVAIGICKKNVQEMHSMFIRLFAPCESALFELVESIDNDHFQNICAGIAVDEGKRKSIRTLSYGELLRISIAYMREGGEPDLLSETEALWATTKPRNAFSHSRFSEISMQDALACFSALAAFLGKWEQLSFELA